MDKIEFNCYDKLTLSKSEYGINLILDNTITNSIVDIFNNQKGIIQKGIIIYLRRTEEELKNLVDIWESFKYKYPKANIEVSENKVYSNGEMLIYSCSLDKLNNILNELPNNICKIIFDDYDISDENNNIHELTKSGDPIITMPSRLSKKMISELMSKISFLNPTCSIHIFKRYYAIEMCNGLISSHTSTIVPDKLGGPTIYTNIVLCYLINVLPHKFDYQQINDWFNRDCRTRCKIH